MKSADLGSTSFGLVKRLLSGILMTLCVACPESEDDGEMATHSDYQRSQDPKKMIMAFRSQTEFEHAYDMTHGTCSPVNVG